MSRTKKQIDRETETYTSRNKLEQRHIKEAYIKQKK